MDYRELLRKYMQHVANEESITYVDSCKDDDSPKYENEWDDVRFTVEEIAELRAIEEGLVA